MESSNQFFDRRFLMNTGMERNLDSLEEHLLIAVNDDILAFEQVVAVLCAGHGNEEAYGAEAVSRALMYLIARKLMGVYLLHAEHPYVTPVEAKLETLPTYWFALTDKGQKVLRTIRQKAK